jgi:hypothetical protein
MNVHVLLSFTLCIVVLFMYTAKMKEFEQNQNDKNRFKGNSSKFLKEERFRKHFATQYPILLDTLREAAHRWEEKEERELKVRGIPILKALDVELAVRKDNSELLHLKLKIGRGNNEGTLMDLLSNRHA